MTQVFLSHQHDDGAEARRLSREIEQRLKVWAIEAHVFATSRPADRFQDFEDLARPADNWALLHEAWANELRSYLRAQLGSASAYLLLLTRSRYARDSPWVRWEIQEGSRLARERRMPFVPCLLGVGFEALEGRATSASSPWTRREVGDLDPGHPERTFQAVRLDETDGLAQLAEILRRSL
jgi:antiphage defense system Thoeris ThsB-like protein